MIAEAQQNHLARGEITSLIDRVSVAVLLVLDRERHALPRQIGRSHLKKKVIFRSEHRPKARAMRDGARTLRVVGDVSGGSLARVGAFDQVLEYEAAYERLARRFPVATACLYDARSHSGLETARLVQRHPDLFRHPIAQFVS